MGSHDGRPTESVEDVVRGFLARDLANWIKSDPLARAGDDEGIHQIRVSARRLRAEFGVVGPDMRRAPLARLRDDLRWIGSVLGHQRDLDVLRHTLLHAAPQPERAASLVHDVERQRDASRLLVRDSLNSRRYRQLLFGLTSALISPPCRRSATRDASALLPGVRRHVAVLESLLEANGDDPTDEQLHHVRIAVKRCRYGVEVTTMILGPDADQLATSFTTAQSVLGDLHDTVVALAYLDTIPPQFDDHDADVPGTRDGLASTRLRLRGEWRAPVDAALALARSLDLAPTTGAPSGKSGAHEGVS
ncbi:MAG: CHAD domain-containing protein [Acidimicrobiales bacterium]